MDALEAIHSRYSCRAFSPRILAPAHLRAIAEAALAAPSGMNRQPWRIVVITDAQVLANLERTALEAIRGTAGYDRIMSRGGKVFYSAPAMIVIAAETNESGTVDPGVALDCGIVAENIALAATALGVNSVICGMASAAFQRSEGRDLLAALGGEPGFVFGISVLLGYAKDSGGTPHELDPTKVRYV